MSGPATRDVGVAAPAVARSNPVLVTGGAGFVGSNVAMRLATEGHDVLVFDALARNGVEENLEWLRRKQPRRISVSIADVRDESAVSDSVADAGAIFHFAAQVAVTTSLAAPLDDFGANVRGTLNLLEAVRHRPIPFIFASTNKVYGDLSDIQLDKREGAYLPVDAQLRAYGVDEARPLSFHTPYGCSKGAADQYVLDYARSYGIPAAVLRMSCVYGPRQFGTEDQGWVAHFLVRALARRPITVYGDGCQVRDILYVDDAVSAYTAAWRHIGAIRGTAFNLGGGPANAVSLGQVLAHIEKLLGRTIDVSFANWRPGDQRYFVSDTRRISQALGLPRAQGWQAGMRQLAAWLQEGRLEPTKDRPRPAPIAITAGAAG